MSAEGQAMKPKIHHIVFDIGKVLIHYDAEIPYRRLIPDDAERGWFFQNVCTAEWNLEQDRGRDWGEAEAMLIAKYPEQEANIRAFRQHWHEMVSHAYAENAAILEQLVGEGHDVTMLTNFASDTFAAAQEMYPFLKLPRGVTVSGRVGLIKPDPAIYRLHAETFDLDPAHCLFIDDSLPNVETARGCGWHAVQFSGSIALRDLLGQFNI